MQTFRKILVPLDDSEHSKNAFAYAMGLAHTQGAHVVLLHSYGRIPMLVGGEARQTLVKDLVKDAEKLLNPYAKKMRGIGVEPGLIIKEGSAGDVIISEAKSGEYDLVVMGSRGLSDLEGMILGSATHRVLSAAPCPVLVVR